MVKYVLSAGVASWSAKNIQLGHAWSNSPDVSAGGYELHGLRLKKKTNRSIDASKMLKSRN